MRAGPFSNTKIIEVLNGYFVPVTAANENYGPQGVAPPAEKTEYSRIYNEAFRKGIGVGDVHVYLTSPDGQVIDSISIGDAMQWDRLLAHLEAVTKKLHTPPGPPAVAPRPQVTPPTAPAGSLVCYLVARGGPWQEFPAENWVVLTAAESKTLLPPLGAQSWQVPAAVASKLLGNFYPRTEERIGDAAGRNRIDRQSLTLTMMGVEDSVATARLDGNLRMKHTFYPSRDDNNFVDATLKGFLEFDPVTRRIQRLRLATHTADYGGRPFAAALRSLSKEQIQELSPASSRDAR